MAIRYFMQGGSVRVVGEGIRPESIGIDTRAVLEVPRPPEAYERWVGPNRGWVVSEAVRARVEREVRLRDPNYIAALEDRLARLEAMLGLAPNNEGSSA